MTIPRPACGWRPGFCRPRAGTAFAGRVQGRRGLPRVAESSVAAGGHGVQPHEPQRAARRLGGRDARPGERDSFGRVAEAGGEVGHARQDLSAEHPVAALGAQPERLDHVPLGEPVVGGVVRAPACGRRHLRHRGVERPALVCGQVPLLQHGRELGAEVVHDAGPDSASAEAVVHLVEHFDHGLDLLGRTAIGDSGQSRSLVVLKEREEPLPLRVHQGRRDERRGPEEAAP